jgi:hypothetical protein
MSREILWYFVKDLKIHKYPVPNRCKVKHTNEIFYFKPPMEYEKCVNCFPNSPK